MGHTYRQAITRASCLTRIRRTKRAKTTGAVCWHPTALPPPYAASLLRVLVCVRGAALLPGVCLFLRLLVRVRAAVLLPGACLFLRLLLRVRAAVLLPGACLFLRLPVFVRAAALLPGACLFLRLLVCVAARRRCRPAPNGFCDCLCVCGRLLRGTRRRGLSGGTKP